MKYIIWIRENQNGLFKLFIVSILICWTYIFYNINRQMPDIWNIERSLSRIEINIDALRK